MNVEKFKDMLLEEKNSEFIKAVEAGNLEAVNALIELGVNVNINRGFPIRYATVMGDLEMIRTLIKAGADAHVALICVAENNNKKVCKALIEADINIAVRDYEALHVAINNRNWAVLVLMLQKIIRTDIWYF